MAMIADVESPELMCSQGDVISGIVDELVRDGIILARDARWQKASTWVLTVKGGKIDKASYIPPPRTEPSRHGKAQPQREGVPSAAATRADGQDPLAQLLLGLQRIVDVLARAMPTLPGEIELGPLQAPQPAVPAPAVAHELGPAPAGALRGLARMGTTSSGKTVPRASAASSRSWPTGSSPPGAARNSRTSTITVKGPSRNTTCIGRKDKGLEHGPSAWGRKEVMAAASQRKWAEIPRLNPERMASGRRQAVGLHAGHAEPGADQGGIGRVPGEQAQHLADVELADEAMGGHVAKALDS